MEPKATLADLERVTGVTFKTLKKRLEGLQPSCKQGLEIFYSLKEALPLIYGKKDSDLLDLTQQRARLAKVQADKIILETERMRANLVDVKEWNEEFAKAFIAMKDALKNMGLRLADQVTQCKTREEAYSLINRYTNETLNELANAATKKVANGDEKPVL